MNKLEYFKRFLILFGVLLSGCSDDILDEIDTDPNAVSRNQVRESSVFTLALERIVANQTSGIGTFAVTTFAEHTANAGLNDFLISDFTIENPWTSLYQNVNDLSIVIEVAEENENYKFLGASQILLAYALNIGTDLYGDIPFSEAVQPFTVENPSPQAQEELYQSIQQLLDAGIENLGRTSDENFASSDVLFNGDLDLWVKMAYGLKARYYNRLSNRSNFDSEILTSLNNSFTNEGENAIFSLFDANGNQNPLGADIRRDQLVVNQNMLNVMQEFNSDVTGEIEDPRAAIWFSLLEGEYVGAPGHFAASADPTGFSVPLAPYYDQGAPQPILTYFELKFIEAETQLRAGNTTGANEAYEEAVAVAMRFTGIDQTVIDGYVANSNVFPGQTSLSLEDIIKQKYIAFFIYQGIEAYNDQRRTGFPTTIENHPVRLPIPQAIEGEVNSNLPTENYDTLTEEDKVWWAL